MDTDIAELGERVTRALDEENTGTLADRIAVIARRARIARIRAILHHSAPYHGPVVTGPSRDDAAAGGQPSDGKP